ncbi:MAG: phosphatase PAP2 family protein [Eubacterium sp.]
MIEVFDRSILEWFQMIHNDIATAFLSVLTKLGEAGILWIIVSLLMLIGLKEKKYGVIVLLSLLFCLIFGNGLLKNLVARPRPCHQVHIYKMLIPIPKDYSFPSGHTFSSVAATICIWHWNHKYGIAAGVVAVLMMFSRMYFYVHYPTDILAGIVLGTVLALLSIHIVEKTIVSERWKNWRKKQKDER